LGCFLGFSGLSWEPLGASWGDLGAKLGGLGATFGALGFLMIFLSDFGSKKGAQREAFWEPKRSKDKKTRCKFKSEKVTSWSRLGAILGRFPRCRGVNNVDFSMVFKGFREHQRF
jgi:hypothetical protein